VLFFPILIYFLQEKGFSYQQISLYQAVTLLTQAAWQIPSGYIADRWGRKPAIVSGSALSFCGVFSYAFHPTITGFLLGGVLTGTGSAFLSGAIEALTYESLPGHRTHDFRRIFGMQSLLRFSAEAIASLLGGALVLIHLPLPFFATLIPYAFLILFALFLIEPTKHYEYEEHHLRAIIRIADSALLKNKALRGIILSHSFFSAFCITLYWFSQPYQKLVGLPLWLFGLSHALVVGCGGIASSQVQRMRRWMSDRYLWLSIVIVTSASYLILGLFPSIFSLIFIVVVRVAWGFLVPLNTDVMSHMTKAKDRATVLSIAGMGVQLVWSFLPFVSSIIADTYSLHTALLFLGILGFIAAFPLSLLLRPTWKATEAM
jgi:MFS family permease